jgi:dGTPase
MQELNLELKQYLFKSFYRHFRVVRMATKAERLLRGLFDAYIEQPLQLPLETQQRAEEHEEGLHRVVCDYIAGMTDRYAIQEHKRLYDPEERA